MTRINLIDPVVMTKKQLIAEYRELPRIPNKIWKRKKRYKSIPLKFKMGSGHESFFGDKLLFLKRRHQMIRAEIFRLKEMKPDAWPGSYSIDLEEVFSNLEDEFSDLFNDFSPSEADMEISLGRLLEKLLNYNYDHFQNEKLESVEWWEVVVRVHHNLK